MARQAALRSHCDEGARNSHGRRHGAAWGPMGFGANSHLHTAKILRLSEDLPLVIEMVDSKEKIDAFMPFIDEMVQEGLVTLERVQVIKYRAGLMRRKAKRPQPVIRPR